MMWTLEHREPVGSLKKLWSGFCHPSKNQRSDDDEDDDSGTGGMVGSTVREPDQTLREIPTSNAALHPLRNKMANYYGDEDHTEEEIEVTSAEQVNEYELIKATYFGRRNRVVRGLGVAVVALLAVFTTLFLLQKIEMGDFTFAVVGDDSLSGERISKPLIHIQYNERKTKTTTAQTIEMEALSDQAPEDQSVNLETDNLTVDRVQQKLDELRELVMEIKSMSEL